MSAFINANTVPAGTVLTPDLVIVGAGPAGITLAMALANLPIKILLLESGGLEFEDDTQKLYAGPETGNVKYLGLDASRLRMLGGSTNHWGGWTRPLDPSDFDKRNWLPFSGWPLTHAEFARYIPRAQQLIEAGPAIFDAIKHDDHFGPSVKLGKGGVYTSWFQFSKSQDDLPTPFGKRYAETLQKQANLQVMLHANVTGLRLAKDAAALDHLDVATLTGNKFQVKPHHTVLACGAIENARLLLASNDVMKTGIGNDNDLVGRFFADHAIPRDTATLILFNGQIPAYWKTTVDMQGVHARATFSPTEAFKAEHNILGSLTTVEQHLDDLDPLARAAVAVTASALGVDATHAKGWSMGCGIELAPDPDRRVTLTRERDALGIPRVQLDMRMSDQDFSRYRRTMKELGRQLLASKAGLVRLNRRTRSEWLETMDWGNHHLGTTRMSDDPKTGVVDANLKVNGVANLFVAGSSTFPTYGSSNPTMNLVALTLRLADYMKGLLG